MYISCRSYEVRSLLEDHLDKKLDQYVDGKINASQRRVLTIKWVNGAWSKVGKMKDSIICSFTECNLSVAFFFFLFRVGFFLSVAYLTVANLARLGISVHC